MDHKSNLWDEELTAHLNQSVHVHLTSLRFTDTLKIKNTILTYYFSPTAAVCMERGCAVNFYCMLSNCLVISILPQLTIFKALFHSSFWASKSSTPAWSCRVKTCGFWFCWVFFLLPPPPPYWSPTILSWLIAPTSFHPSSLKWRARGSSCWDTEIKENRSRTFQ